MSFDHCRFTNMTWSGLGSPISFSNGKLASSSLASAAGDLSLISSIIPNSSLAFSSLNILSSVIMANSSISATKMIATNCSFEFVQMVSCQYCFIHSSTCSGSCVQVSANGVLDMQDSVATGSLTCVPVHILPSPSHLTAGNCTIDRYTFATTATSMDLEARFVLKTLHCYRTDSIFVKNTALAGGVYFG